MVIPRGTRVSIGLGRAGGEPFFVLGAIVVGGVIAVVGCHVFPGGENVKQSQVVPQFMRECLREAGLRLPVWLLACNERVVVVEGYAMGLFRGGGGEIGIPGDQTFQRVGGGSVSQEGDSGYLFCREREYDDIDVLVLVP